MSTHRVVWNAEDERLDLVCEAPADALCKWEAECDCETYSDIAQAKDGSWSHGAYDWTLVDTLGEEVRHQHSRPADECHYMVWWTEYELGRENGPKEAFWLYDDNDVPIPPPVGPITFRWTHDCYEWDYEKQETPA